MADQTVQGLLPKFSYVEKTKEVYWLGCETHKAMGKTVNEVDGLCEEVLKGKSSLVSVEQGRVVTCERDE